MLVGGWALLAPHGWFDTFPGGGRHWVPRRLAPTTSTSVRDFGATYLALGLLLVGGGLSCSTAWSCSYGARARRSSSQVPHFIFHLGETGPLSTRDNVPANLALLGAGLALTLSSGLVTWQPRARTAQDPRTILKEESHPMPRPRVEEKSGLAGAGRPVVCEAQVRTLEITITPVIAHSGADMMGWGAFELVPRARAQAAR